MAGREREAAIRVLVAEDESIIRLDLCSLLERQGFELCAAVGDGARALELARRERPDVALLDVKMPGLDGVELARAISREAPAAIVMITAFSEESLVRRASEAGAWGYLVKPFREEDVAPAIAVARGRFEELHAERTRVEALTEELAARKAIERAKGLLMEREGLSENEAYARLRKASQTTGRKLAQIAEAVILALDPKATAPPSGR